MSFLYCITNENTQAKTCNHNNNSNCDTSNCCWFAMYRGCIRMNYVKSGIYLFIHISSIRYS